jgi:hypothetical protein
MFMIQSLSGYPKITKPLLARLAQGKFDLVASVRSFARHMWDRDGGAAVGRTVAFTSP